MNRLLFVLPAILMAGTFVACSGTSKTTSTAAAPQDSVRQQLKSTPLWYNQEEVVSESSSINGYATAIDSDSASAVSKAVERATILLRQSVSNRLESVRFDAISELGSKSGLDNPGFLIALRKADNAVNEVVSTQQTSAVPIDGQDSFRGFAGVQVDRAELIQQMGKQLSSHQETWDALLNSDAFVDF